jgi:G3E family GTPase
MTISSPEFVVLTGFLGSGKTTLLRHFLARPEAADTAVIVNEAGEIGLDGAILRESGSDAPMTMLANGCICCQGGGELADTVDTLLAMKRPNAPGPLRRVVLETSGLSKPGPVLRQLAALVKHRLRISVVATFDAVRGTEAAAFEEAASQWSAAHRIVVTKTDLVSEQGLMKARAEVVAFNPLAQIVATRDSDAAAVHAFASLPRAEPAFDLRRVSSGTAHPRVRICIARPTAALTRDELATWLDNLAGGLGERLLRLKGLVRVAEYEQPMLVQSVGTLFAPLRPFGVSDASEPLLLVIIARDLEIAQLAAVSPRGIFQFSGRSASSQI